MPQLAATPAKADVDRTIIRLHSQHKWPERIVIDTSLPTIVPPPVEVAEAAPLKSPPVVRPAREAFALAAPVQAAPAIARRATPKRRIRTARASGHVASFEPTGFRDALPVGW
jgi:hypothetical protein